MISAFCILLLPVIITAFTSPSSRTPVYSFSSKRFTSRMQSDSDRDVWIVRRKIIRSLLTPVMEEKLEKEKQPKVEESGEKSKEGLKTAFVVSAFFVAISATVLRIGGRAALVSAMGLDFVTDSGMKEQVDGFIATFQSLGDVRYLSFLVAWIVTKNLFLDPATIVLALSSGVLFGGLWQGVAASVLCSTTASLIGFYLARSIFREKALAEIQKRPALRAIDRACSKEGFKTVFTLRVSPFFPIPMGAYNFIYGTTSVSAIDFALGLSLGSIKPYFLDSYLGIFGKSIIDNDNSQNDFILVAVVGVVILVGSLAANLASQTWEEIQKEVGGEEKLKEERGNEDMPSDWQKMTGIKDSDLPAPLLGFKKDLDAAWSRVNDVMEDEVLVDYLSCQLSMSLSNCLTVVAGNRCGAAARD